MLFYNLDGDLDDEPDDKADNYDDCEGEGEENEEAGDAWRPDGGGEIVAIKGGGGNLGFGGESLVGRVFIKLASETIEVALAVPSPAIGDGLRLADGHGGGENITIRIIIGKIILGVLNGFGGVTNIALLEIEGAGAKDYLLDAIFFNNIDNDMGKSIFLKFL